MRNGQGQLFLAANDTEINILEATTIAFRERYLSIVRSTAREYLWPYQRDAISIVPAALGDLSQSIGAALAALYKARS